MATSAYQYRILTLTGKTPEAIEAELNAAGGAGFMVRDIVQDKALILLEKYTTLDELVEGRNEP